MKTKTLLLLFLLVVLSGPVTKAQDYQWAISYSQNIGEGFAVTVDASKNVYTTGYFLGTIDFDPGPGTFTMSALDARLFITKLDSTGNFIWARSIGPDSAVTMGSDVQVDLAGNVYITGNVSASTDFDPGPGTYMGGAPDKNIFILKLNSYGNFVWAKIFGETPGVGFSAGPSLKLDLYGNIYLCGTFILTGDFDPGPAIYNLTSAGVEDVFICKLNNQGNFVWARSLGGLQSDYSYDLALDRANVYITGNFQDTADFDPGPGISALTSSVYISSSISYTAFATTAFITKLDSAGNYVWAKKISGLDSTTFGDSFSYSIAWDGHNSIYASGFPGFISRSDLAGNSIWTAFINGGGGSTNLGVVADAGHVYTGGYFQSVCDLDPGPGVYNLNSPTAASHVLKLDSAGSFEWAIGLIGYPTFGNQSELYSVARDASGNIYTTGSFWGTVDFDPGTDSVLLNAFYLSNSGSGYSAYIAKYGPCNPQTNASVADLCAGQSSTLSASGAGSYTWMPGGQTSHSIVVTPATTSSYTVEGEAGCKNVATITVSVDVCTGIKSNTIQVQSLSVFPNPNTGEFQLTAQESMNLEIINEQGQKVRSCQLAAENNFTTTLSGFARGIYFIKGEKSNKKISVVK